MPPFTTYNIPESPKRKTTSSTNWLWIISNQAISAAQEEILSKICQALKADFSSEVYVLTCDPDHPLSISDFETNHTSFILSFGIHPSALGIWIDLKQPGIKFLEAYTFILSVPLDELILHPASKKQLWSSMQSYLQMASGHQK